MELFSDNTLYYYFSTIAQVVAATVALVSIAIQFRIINLRRHLVGDGQAVYNRAIAGESGYEVLDDRQRQRLSDAIEREDLDGIGDVIGVLIEANSPKPGIAMILNPHGFHQLNTTFFKALNDLKEMKFKIISIVRISIISIVVALISLVLIDYYKCIPVLKVISVVVSLILFIATMVMNYKGIKKGLE